MEPNKFEEHIKAQMRKREIQPSASAWDKISERLESAPKQNNNQFLWYSIAASFIGIMIISILFFQSDDKQLESDVQIVDTNKGEMPNNEVNTSSKEQNPPIEERNINVDSGSITINEIVVPEKHSNKETFELQNADSDKIVLNDDKVKKIEVNELLGDSESSIEQKLKEVLAQVDSLELNNAALTNEEVDELLRHAQEEILRDKLLRQNGSVDAMALLTEVEDELDQSFRDQIFESLKAGFLKVRTAVADRNK